MQAEALWWSLAIGADFGGNLTAIGASANVVVLGVAKPSGFPISFWQFTRTRAVVTVITVHSQFRICGCGISSCRADTPWQIGGRRESWWRLNTARKSASVGIGTSRRHRCLPADRRSAGSGSTCAYVRPDLAMGGDRCRRALAATLGR